MVESKALKDDISHKKPSIFAIWHGDELVMISLTRRYNVCTLTSTSSDGELMDFVLRKMGMKTARGSSSKKAISGLKALIRLARNGFTPVFAVDGPRGPYKKIKPGVFEMAKLTKANIYAAGVASSKSYVFEKAWNKAYLPHFFAKVVIVWSEPLKLEEIKDPREDWLKVELQKNFDAAQQLAVQHLAEQCGEC